MIKAPVNNIIPFSNVDGPGNRCAIFFQSCPLRCLYCHNPETIHMCTHCGNCVITCPTHALSIVDQKVSWKKELCVNCDTCIHVCPHLASPKIQEMSVQELVQEVVKRKAFIRGITVSGGECMNQASFLLPFFKEIKKLGLSILIDSNGYYDFKEFSELLDICDGVMLDVKAVDAQFHFNICHTKNDVILKNLDYLLDSGKLEEVRTVLLPHQKDRNIETIRYVVQHIQNRCRYKLLAYRPYGVRAEGLSVFGNQQLSEEECNEYVEFAKALGNVTVTLV